LPFCLQSKMVDRVLFAVTIWGRKVSPSASKCANNWDRMAFRSVLCSAVSL
jgi:hypothetical protein